MRSSPTILIAAMALLSWSAALGIKHGLVLCAGDLSSEPFVDTAKLGPLASNHQ